MTTQTTDPPILSKQNVEQTKVVAKTMGTKGLGRSTKERPFKRTRSSSVEITDERPAKKNCWIKLYSISVPLNDGEAYEEAMDSNQFYTYCPSDSTNIGEAIRERYMSHVILGMHGNTVIESLVSDKETKIPWQIPKITVEFNRIRWQDEEQKQASWCKTVDGQPVSPTSMPTVRQMTKLEYEEAVQVGNVRVALEDQYVFEVCCDMEVDWLSYEDR